MECAEVGSSNGLENRGNRKVNCSMLSHSAIMPTQLNWQSNSLVMRRLGVQVSLSAPIQWGFLSIIPPPYNEKRLLIIDSERKTCSISQWSSEYLKALLISYLIINLGQLSVGVFRNGLQTLPTVVQRNFSVRGLPPASDKDGSRFDLHPLKYGGQFLFIKG